MADKARETMKRSLKFALRFANTGKREQLDHLWEIYRDAVNFFVEDEEITGEAEWRDCQLGSEATII